MAINIDGNSIDFDTFPMFKTTDGVAINGKITASEFIIIEPKFQGVVSGYSAGGRNGGARNTIDKFPFASDANATDV